MTKSEAATGYLGLIVSPLTKSPDQVKITSQIDDAGNGIILNVLASDKDLSLLIGKKGIVARSIRRIMKVWCDVNDARVLIHIGQPFKGND